MRPLLAVLLAGLPLGCSQTHQLFENETRVVRGVPLPADLTWGEFAATLDVPPCPPGESLVVGTTSVESGGTALSFPEAIAMAAAQGEPTTILFDPDVFPVDAPAIIEVDGPLFSPVDPAMDVCIDGRNRGIVFRWSSSSVDSGAAATVWSFFGRSVMVGLTFLNLPYEFAVHSGTQVAGCRFNTDGREMFVHDFARPWSLDVYSGIVGPGNVFAGVVAARVSGPAMIRENYFGYDPISDQRFELTEGLDIRAVSGAALRIEANVFAASGRPFPTWSLGPGSPALLAVSGNLFGVDPTGRFIEGAQAGLSLAKATGVFGPANVIRGAPGPALELQHETSLRITENRISGNQLGIVYSDAAFPGPSAPVVLQASSRSASGSCPAEGIVEVFADPDDQGETFVGRTSCGPEQSWSIAWTRAVAAGLSITATFTDASSTTSPFSSPIRIP